MEGFHIIHRGAEKQNPNHELPLKPIDKLNVKVDKLSLDIQTMKSDMKIIIDYINSTQKSQNKGYWY